jgi:hypothetical protein
VRYSSPKSAAACVCASRGRQRRVGHGMPRPDGGLGGGSGVRCAGVGSSPTRWASGAGPETVQPSAVWLRR